MHFHDAVDAFRIGRFAPGLFGLPAQQSMNAAIAARWQISDEHSDVGNQLSIRQRWSSAWSGGSTMVHCGLVWASDDDRLCDRDHRPSRSNEVERKSGFLGLRPGT